MKPQPQPTEKTEAEWQALSDELLARIESLPDAPWQAVSDMGDGVVLLWGRWPDFQMELAEICLKNMPGLGTLAFTIGEDRWAWITRGRSDSDIAEAIDGHIVPLPKPARV